MFWCLPWFTPRCEILKVKAMKNLLEYYLGNFLEKITLDQLSVNFKNGTGIVCDVTLKCDELNKYADEEHWPLHIKKGRMTEISVSVPWTENSKTGSMLKVDGLTLTVKPKTRHEPVISVLNWISAMWTKWAVWSSHKVHVNRKEQLERLAHHEKGEMDFLSDVIYSKLKRINVKFENTKIIVEHMPKDFKQGITLEIDIKNFDYYEDDITVPYADENSSDKRIIFEGITLSTDEFMVYNSFEDLDMEDALEDKTFTEQKIGKIEEDSVDIIDVDIQALEPKIVHKLFDPDVGQELTPTRMNPMQRTMYYWLPQFIGK